MFLNDGKTIFNSIKQFTSPTFQHPLVSSSRCLIDTTFNQVPSLIAQLKNLHANTNTYKFYKWNTQKQNKLNSRFHFLRHNLPKNLIEICPNWV